MKYVSFAGACGVFLGTFAAHAQEPESATDADPPPTSAESATNPTSGDTATSPEGADDDNAQAAPDVQRQVGMGTEKERPQGEETAAQEQQPVEPGESLEEGEDDTYGHAMQFGIRAGLVPGFRMIFRYDNSPFCKEPDPTIESKKQSSTCGFTAPLATEVALSFAPFDSLEPYLWGRFGLSGEAETNTRALKVFGVGARIYTMSDSRFKIFFEPGFGVEFEEGAGNPDYNPPDLDVQYKTDMVFHVGIGPQFDFAKAVGLYLNAGLDVGVLRAIHATMFGNIGVQVRVP